MALPWTKFQDFYLRLGFLKVLVGSLSPERRSSTNDVLARKVSMPLLEPAKKYPSLWSDVQRRVPWYQKDHAQGKFDKPSVTEALLVVQDCPSWLFAVTAATAYKILDWGHDLQFVGRGNQITERGLLLRSLLPSGQVERFLGGDPTAWNPFILSDPERLFFLYHLAEVDQVTRDLISQLADIDQGKVLEASEAGKLTCRALFGVLGRVQAHVLPRDLPAYRVARELATVIATELRLDDLLSEFGPTSVRRAPRPRRIPARGGVGGATKREHTTKSSDHQAIPRFEQLTDLGFLTKPEPQSEQPGEVPKKRWKYQATTLCKRWRDGLHAVPQDAGRWEWHGFARTAIHVVTGATARYDRDIDHEVAIRYLWEAYQSIRRPMGHTPFDSVALLAMIRAVADGFPIEMAQFHRMMLAIKQGSLLPEHSFFASGNDLEKMFILLKPGFRERAQTIASALPPLRESA